MDLSKQNEWIMFEYVCSYLPLIATTCAPFSKAHRKTSRPIRPKPLIPIFTSDEAAMFTILLRMRTMSTMNFVRLYDQF